MKNEGITLISLIVTVIIMLILAAVTINLITNGGLITKARTAANDYQYEAEKEEFEIAVVSAKDFLTGEVNEENLKLTLSGWEVEILEDEIKAKSPNKNEFTKKIEAATKEDDTEEEPEVLVYATQDGIEYLESLQDYQNKISQNPDWDIQKYLEEDKNYTERDLLIPGLDIEELSNIITDCLNENKSVSEFLEYCENNEINFKSFKNIGVEQAGEFMFFIKNHDKIIIYASLGDQFRDGVVNILEESITSTKKDAISFNLGEMGCPVYFSTDKKTCYLMLPSD